VLQPIIISTELDRDIRCNNRFYNFIILSILVFNQKRSLLPIINYKNIYYVVYTSLRKRVLQPIIISTELDRDIRCNNRFYNFIILSILAFNQICSLR
jgi:hypothetical protein